LAEKAVVDAVEVMRCKLGLSRNTAEMVKDIKATIHAPLPPHDLTVIQTLYDHYRADVFNADAAEARPNAREKLDKAVRDLAVARGAWIRAHQCW
jgi:hypothetical protein